MKRRATIWLACLAVAIWAAGCRVNVEKNGSGDSKNVQVDTPFGGIRVNTGQTTAADVGLPAYPGAQLATGDEKHQSANVRMGFGDWQMHVQVASYTTPDSEQKVAAFYRNALRSYGDVITCRDGTPVGTPASTADGLNCSDHGHAHVNVSNHGENYGYQPDRGGLELKSGSERHQHIVGFETAQAGQTRFALVEVDLPSKPSGGSGKSD